MDCDNTLPQHHSYEEFNEVVLALQRDDAHPSELAGRLFRHAQQCMSEGKQLQAELFYLRAIDIWRLLHDLQYPVVFRSIHDYAEMMFKHSQRSNLKRVRETRGQDKRLIA